MRFPAACYQMRATLAPFFAACLTPSQCRGLALWVHGTILAGSACQTSVAAALTPDCEAGVATIRQYLREWLYDGQDKAAPCHTEIAIADCFAPLLRWLLHQWQADQLMLALDVTNLADRWHALAVSALYRGCAIPVAWHLRRGGQQGEWTPEFVRLLACLAPAVPAELTTVVLMDAGLRSPTLWDAVCGHGWHVIQRQEAGMYFRPMGWEEGCRADQFVRTAGHAWVGTGTAFKQAATRRDATLAVVWEEGASAPWVLLTDLAPHQVGVTWYGLRMWMELGFRALKGLGWQWERTRRTDPVRAERHWLVLATATGMTLATGTRVEDAAAVGMPPTHLHAPPTAAIPRPPPRVVSVFLLGLSALRLQCSRGRLWQCLWLAPEPWPRPPPTLTIWYDGGAVPAGA